MIEKVQIAIMNTIDRINGRYGSSVTLKLASEGVEKSWKNEKRKGISMLHNKF